MLRYKLGRTARKYNPSVPHFSTMVKKLSWQWPAMPAILDTAQSFPVDYDYGMLGNDTHGDCTCATVYHCNQVWDKDAQNSILNVSNNTALQLYREMGWDGTEATDTGCNEQDVLTYLIKAGAPLDNGTRKKISAFFEVDVRNMDDIKRVIYECGTCYIGMQMPAEIAQAGYPEVWDITSSPHFEGGHAFNLVGYDATGFIFITYGKKYKMTYKFWQATADEAYAIISPDWVEQTGKTPFGLTASDLTEQMAALKTASYAS